MWNRPLAEQSWRAYLGRPLRRGRRASLRRARAGRPTSRDCRPAYVSTAEIDPLRDEGIMYALRLLQAGVSVELHQFAGTFHGSAMVTTAAVSIRAQRGSLGRSPAGAPSRGREEHHHMTDVLSAKARALMARPVLATLATVSPDGSPQVSPLWVDVEGDNVVFNTARGRAKARNLERDPRVAVTVIDPDDAYNVVVFRGTVLEITTEGADEHIDFLAKKYLGADSYPFRREEETRIRVVVRTDRITMQG